uniref:Ribosomal protein L44E (RP-L44e, RPL44) n=1 Tax=uncultured marine thaumarchaeote KM3_98_B07 TaxID=1456351 RepID=A0A075I5A5_9ARCH|nr:ribosomal protein L44E (RP-L44e, RPL44) [uncultured marine thaumarchaeote KM3_98_B07]
MNIPKEINRFCPKCKKHVVQKISIYKAGKRRGTAAGERRHALRKKGMEDKNSPSLQSLQKQQRKLHRSLHAQNARRRL